MPDTIPPGSDEDMKEAESRLDTLLNSQGLRYYLLKKHTSHYSATIAREDGDEVTSVGDSYVEAAERALVGWGEWSEDLGDA